MQNKKEQNAKIIFMEQPFQIKPYSKAELVKIYRPITMHVLNKWLEHIEPETGPVIARTLSVKQMEVFVRHYGVPGLAVRESNEELKNAA